MLYVRNHVLPRGTKGEEAIKTLDFQQDIGGMASCMNIIMKDTKGRC